MLKLTAIGHLGKDAIINNVNGKQVINFSVAHTEKFTTNGEQKEKTVWVDCAYWSDSKVGPYLKKGTQVYVEGTPEARSYPKNDGTTGVTLSVRVFSVQLLGGKSNEEPAEQPTTYQQNSAQPVTQQQISNNNAAPAEDLPF